jgi:hypothetical protein
MYCRSGDTTLGFGQGDKVEPPTQFRGLRRFIDSDPASSLLRLLCFVALTNMDHSSVSSNDLNRLCNRFRVLIIGRRNAGKTTILENMTGSEEGAKPEIRNKKGRLVVSASPIYVTSILKLMGIGQPHTCQGRVGGPLSR